MKKSVIIGTAAAVVIAAVGSTSIYWNLPTTRLGRELERAMDYMTAMEYVQAEEAFTEALSIDEKSVKAYRGLADDYLAQGKHEEAENILRQGHIVTGSEVLLQNYCATVLNYAVKEINNGMAGLHTIERCLNVLEEAPDNEDAKKLLSTCAQRILFQDGKSAVMLDDMDGESSFDSYRSIVERLFSLAGRDPEGYTELVKAYSLADASGIYLSLANADGYREILKKADSLGVEDAQELLSCLDMQEEVSAFFAPVFEEFEAENFKAVKDFIITDEYTGIRDAFINDTMDKWSGNTFVPVTKEAIILEWSEDGWKFSFVEDDALAKPTGTIRVLGQKMKDLGVQRSTIEYVPAYDPAEYYPHTEYEITYWNTMVSGIATDNTNVVSRMNYRFAEKIYTAQGMEANMIYDWGGPNEKRQKE